MNPNYTSINVKDSIANEDSILNYYKKLIKMRKQYPAFIYGEYLPLLEDDKHLFCYLRVMDQQKFAVILNFSDAEVNVVLPTDVHLKNLLLDNYDDIPNKEKLVLRPYEAQVYSC